MDWRLRMGKSVRKVMYGGRAGVHRWSKILLVGHKIWFCIAINKVAEQD